jgi:hypothetical protein
MIGLSTLVFALLLALPAVAHHSFSAEFDSAKKVTLKGYVTKIEWTNPHAWFYLNVKDEAGKITNWGFELGPPHLLAGQGWTRTSMKIGDEIVVQGSLAKNGSKRVNAQNVTFAATGLKMGAASSEGTNP